jgi:thioredoxin reductase
LRTEFATETKLLTNWSRRTMGPATNIPGVWAAGNAANPRAQVITAAGEGSAAAIAINADLVEEDVRNALRAARETSTL